MRLRIRGHPVLRMAERGISEEDIKHAVRHFHTRYETKSHSIAYIGPGVDGRELKVWLLPPGYIDEDTTITVKSAAWRGQE